MTVALIKPDVVENGLVDDIIAKVSGNVLRRSKVSVHIFEPVKFFL